MFQINCLNPISKVGLDRLTADYKVTDNMNDAEGVLVRSASMHEMDLPENLLAVARAGAGVNNIPLDKCAEKGIQYARCQRQWCKGTGDRWYAVSCP